VASRCTEIEEEPHGKTTTGFQFLGEKQQQGILVVHDQYFHSSSAERILPVFHADKLS
jgi:hypothetical protein